MHETKNTARSLVRIGYDGRVHKYFRASDAQTRFDNEIKVLKYLEQRGCPFVPRVLETDPNELKLVTSNCGARVDQLTDDKLKELFEELERYGVRHDDPYLRNITYRAMDGRFCIIDFEFATILDEDAVTPAPTLTSPVGASAPLTFRWSGITDIGRFRPNNEDAFLAVAFDHNDFTYLGKTGGAAVEGMDFVFAVSDGMGGEKSGEFASRLTVDNITQLLPRRYQMSPANYPAGISDFLYLLFQKTHRQLTTLGESYADGHNMGSTLSMLWFCHDRFYFGHIGDSRIYRLPKEGGMQQISNDDTYVGHLRRAGQLNEREARTHPRKNVLSQSLGAGNQFINPQVGEIFCQPGDRFVLCTDGVVDGLWDHAIEDLVVNPPHSLAELPAAQRLVKCAVEESGRDNATAVVLEIV